MIDTPPVSESVLRTFWVEENGIKGCWVDGVTALDAIRNFLDPDETGKTYPWNALHDDGEAAMSIDATDDKATVVIRYHLNEDNSAEVAITAELDIGGPEKAKAEFEAAQAEADQIRGRMLAGFRWKYGPADAVYCGAHIVNHNGRIERVYTPEVVSCPDCDPEFKGS